MVGFHEGEVGPGLVAVAALAIELSCRSPLRCQRVTVEDERTHPHRKSETLIGKLDIVHHTPAQGLIVVIRRVGYYQSTSITCGHFETRLDPAFAVADLEAFPLGRGEGGQILVVALAYPIGLDEIQKTSHLPDSFAAQVQGFHSRATARFHPRHVSHRAPTRQ
jgi:hypothetical protein